MKLLGGKWSKGDILALLGVIAAVMAIPGMPKLLHFDFDSSKHGEAPGTTTGGKPSTLTTRPIQKSRDVTSGQVNFG